MAIMDNPELVDAIRFERDLARLFADAQDEWIADPADKNREAALLICVGQHRTALESVLGLLDADDDLVRPMAQQLLRADKALQALLWTGP